MHRTSDLRAGPVAALLERTQAQARPGRFEQLLEACTCDYAAYPGHGRADYTKPARLRLALAAYLSVERAEGDATALLEARIGAIDRALRGKVRAAGLGAGSSPGPIL